eukprot:TRINITY_DN6055_c0_g1_i1.p1 TRINITY_DN6055_c0_g1~~TRINITY_DN6055_c0_g1_i1.p1  ORF type:complete len:178 (-),score=65.62 TRINITY_DN6055_c0_g1_i1:64-597(-)
MSLNSEEFIEQCKVLCELESTVFIEGDVVDNNDDGCFGNQQPPWKWVDGDGNSVGYLKKKNYVVLNDIQKEEENFLQEENNGEIEDLLNEEDVFEIEEEEEYGEDKSEEEPYLFDYNIIYSKTYNVPVMYFNIYNSENKIVKLDEVWKLLHKNIPQYFKINPERLWSFLTQVVSVFI